MRAEVNKLYTRMEEVLHKLDDKIQEQEQEQQQHGDICSKIQRLRQQLEVKQYVVLIAGNS